MWHVSVSGNAPMREMWRQECYIQIRGLGDAGRGEWVEWSGKAFHLRRRLSEREQVSVGPVVDIRGTPEAVERLQRVALAAPTLPELFWQVALEEVGLVS